MKKTAAVTALTATVLLLISGCSGQNSPGADFKSVALEERTDAVFSLADEGTTPADPESTDTPETERQVPFNGRVAPEYLTWETGKAWTITGAGWEPGEKVNLHFTAAPEGEPDPEAYEAPETAPVGEPLEITADEEGRYDVAVDVPRDMSPGTYTVAVSSGDEQPRLGTMFRVID